MTQALLSGRYLLGQRLARGGMGTVYRADDQVLGRVVAVKVLAEELAEDPEFIERFRREARHAAALLHPNIAGIFDYGTDGGRSYMVMELVDGEDLATTLDREGRLPWPAAMAVGAQVAAALAHAHARGVVHRDIKPANILVTRDGQAKVTDFGIALAVQTTTNLTRTGSVLGTPNYLAPEQAKGERVGPPADQYSLGVVLFEALTGSRPFHGESGLALAMQHVTAPVPDPRSRGVALPEQVAAVVTTAMAKDPAARFGSIEAMRAAILAATGAPAPSGTHQHHQQHQPPPRQPPAQAPPAQPGWAPPATAPLAFTPPGATPALHAPPAQPQAPPAGGAWPRPATDAGAWPPRRRPASSWRRGLSVVAVALVLALAGSAVAYRAGRSSNDRQVTAVTRVTHGTTEVQVPFGLVGKPFSDAQKTLGGLGFEIGASYEFDSQVARDGVIEVSPAEGSFRERGGRVSVTVSKGRGDPVKVPSGLVGATYDQARKALIDADFAVSPSKAFSCDNLPAGKVESVNPPEGSEQQRGATVNVYVC